jgi:hypothetical protein
MIPSFSAVACETMDKKRKKQYYANAAKKAKFGGPRKLSENMRGFLITVNNRFVFGCLGKISCGSEPICSGCGLIRKFMIQIGPLRDSLARLL